MELVSSQTPLPVPTFDIDLDESPSTRWKAVFEAKRSELLNVCRFVETLANFFERKYISNAIVGSKLFQEEHLEEMQSLADYLEVDFSTIVLSNVINEIYSRCSSFVVQTSNGEVLLGRNLDYFLNEKIRLLAVDLRFIKEGEVLYRSMVQAGYFGVTTGMRPGAFAISVNQRDLKDNYMLWEIVGLLSGSQATSFAIRYALEHFKTYEEALNYFNHVPLIVGEYICISGINEGAIITRNRRYVSDLRTIDEDNWFIIQSNYDHWLPQPKDDDRYTPIIKRFEDLGQENIDEDILFQLMTLPPTFRTTTLLTVVANPSAGYWKGTAWS
jgi:hypothetical protein